MGCEDPSQGGLLAEIERLFPVAPALPETTSKGQSMPQKPPTAEITEEWLAEVGFKYRDPVERQIFRHWTLTFSEPSDHGLYIETTMPGVINRQGKHIGTEHGWFVWLGRESKFFHTRHMVYRHEMIALVEALTGQPWEPTKTGHVRVASVKEQRDRQMEALDAS